MTSDDDNLDVPKPVPRPFHEEAVELFQRASQALIQTHPEIRSVISIFDYAGELNSAKIPSAVWLGRGPNGAVQDPSALIGSAQQTLKLLDAVMTRLTVVLQAREQQVLDASKRLLELETRIAKASETQTADGSEAGAAG